jgi:hypothetical protein
MAAEISTGFTVEAWPTTGAKYAATLKYLFKYNLLQKVLTAAFLLQARLQGSTISLLGSPFWTSFALSSFSVLLILPPLSIIVHP